jgi:hypothetical protein
MDGLENDSQEFKRKEIFKMIKHQREVYSWEFVFPDAKHDAISTARERLSSNRAGSEKWSLKHMHAEARSHGAEGHVGATASLETLPLSRVTRILFVHRNARCPLRN